MEKLTKLMPYTLIRKANCGLKESKFIECTGSDNRFSSDTSPPPEQTKFASIFYHLSIILTPKYVQTKFTRIVSVVRMSPHSQQS